jgi:hypothetical protein
MSPDQIAARRSRRRQALASLAIEGIHLSDREFALFDEFDSNGLSDEECRQRILAHLAARQAPVVAE